MFQKQGIMLSIDSALVFSGTEPRSSSSSAHPTKAMDRAGLHACTTKCGSQCMCLGCSPTRFVYGTAVCARSHDGTDQHGLKAVANSTPYRLFWYLATHSYTTAVANALSCFRVDTQKPRRVPLESGFKSLLGVGWGFVQG
jgi:hypothetical protein